MQHTPPVPLQVALLKHTNAGPAFLSKWRSAYQSKPKQNIESVLVVFLDIRSTLLAKIIIDIDIYDYVFDHFVRKVWELRKLLAHKTAAVNAGTRETPITTKETEFVKDTAIFDSDDDVIVDFSSYN
jgi:hypothetical protein